MSLIVKLQKQNQLLGSILYKSGSTKIDNKVLEQYDLFLDVNSYSLIWDELTDKEKDILISAACKSENVKDVLDDLNMNNSTLQVYKTRLLKAGIITDLRRGKILFNLPRFKEYVVFQSKLLTE